MVRRRIALLPQHTRDLPGGARRDRALPIAGALSLVGAITELVSRRVDDNFSIPLAVGVLAAVLL